ncbi:unnamed protein product [Peronospora farinosa]|uniref:Integrase catalytic domain-containing protein n=1 Tax=Peronospora farinosa TaxID=134698 RepID=A0AAV0TLY6_9STRA|nr:unnamed protein product [Peronospora farinosa]
MTPRDRLGNRYLVNFIDHRSNYCRVFLAKTKDAAALKFKYFLVQFEREFNLKIHVLRTDGGGEYKTLDVFCKATGVSRQISEARNQASNGKAERMHRTIMNMDQVEPGWSIPDGDPNEKVPKLTDIVTFGSVCAVHVNARNKSLGERGRTAIIIGKSDETKGYKVYIPKDKVVLVTQHIQNIESLTTDSHLISDQDEICRQEELTMVDKPKTQVRCRGKQRTVKHHKNRKPEWTRERHGTRSTRKRQIEEVSSEDRSVSRGVVNAIIAQDPKNYGEAIKSKHHQEWKIAMTEELDALKANDVWTVVAPPKNAHVLHNKWVYKTKTDANGDIERYKARLVVCGNEQVFEVDYNLTFAAVMDLRTVKRILMLSRRWKVPARHGDVPNAYVKAEKEEHLDIYMKVPKGMTLDGEEIKGLESRSTNDLALLLKKSLYGPKQAGRLWSKLLDLKLKQSGFRQCTTDMCLYFKYVCNTCTVVGVYVDDILVTGTKLSAVDNFFKDMACLSIKDLGVVNKFLGLRIKLDESKGYILDQQVTIELLLKEFGLDSANGVRTPIGDECNLEEEDAQELLSTRSAKNDPSVKSFQSMVGSLLWIARIGRLPKGSCAT